MGDQLIRPPLVRVMLGVGWTTLLALAVVGFDRVFLGSGSRPAWDEVSRFEDVPASAGTPQLPSFLPDSFDWPPVVVVHRTGEARGWWMGLRAATGGEPALWIGAGLDPTPPQLGELGAVVGSPGQPPPEGWHHLSRSKTGAEIVHVIGRLDAETLLRVLEGLKPAVR